MAKRKKFSPSMLLINALGMIVILKVFVWVLGSKVFTEETYRIPELDYALYGVCFLLVLHISYVFLKGRMNRNSPYQKTKVADVVTPEEEGCELCGKPVAEKVKNYCKSHSQRFGGKIYCYDHQKSI